MKDASKHNYDKERIEKMKRTKIFKQIGGVVLAAAIMLGMGGVLLIAEDNSKLTVIAAGETDNNPGDTTTTTIIQKITESIDLDIDRAAAQAASAGQGKGTVRIDGIGLGIHTLPRDTIKKLNRANVDAVFSFYYNGYKYVITIPAGATPVSDDIPWIGPMYLMSLYGNTAVVTPMP